MKAAVFWDVPPQCGKTVRTFQNLLPPSSGQRKLLAKRTYHSIIYIFLVHFICFLFVNSLYLYDRLCGLVVRVSGYRYRGLGFDSRRYQIF